MTVVNAQQSAWCSTSRHTFERLNPPHMYVLISVRTQPFSPGLANAAATAALADVTEQHTASAAEDGTQATAPGHTGLSPLLRRTTEGTLALLDDIEPQSAEQAAAIDKIQVHTNMQQRLPNSKINAHDSRAIYQFACACTHAHPRS